MALLSVIAPPSSSIFETRERGVEKMGGNTYGSEGNMGTSAETNNTSRRAIFEGEKER